MSQHLSPDQFAKCLIGRAETVELQHMESCPECRSELERFGGMLTAFRCRIRGVAESVGDFPLPDFPATEKARESRENGRPVWFAAAAIVVIAIVIPLWTTPDIRQPQTDPNEVMERVHEHLSRRLPAPLEPLMPLFPGDAYVITSGGIQ